MTNFRLVGANFQHTGRHRLRAIGHAIAHRCRYSVQPRFSVPVGVGAYKKEHVFDFGCPDPPVLVEYKCHRWTAGGNAPSAKLTVWNEAMYYFAVAPAGYRRILFVLRDFSTARNQSLVDHYLSRYRHPVPEGVEVWEFDEGEKACRVLVPGA